MGYFILNYTVKAKEIVIVDFGDNQEDSKKWLKKITKK